MSLPQAQNINGLPTPSPTATPSASATFSMSAGPSTFADAAYDHLKQYVHFSQSVPPLPGHMDRILRQWNSSADPSDYDWEGLRRARRDASETEAEELTPAQRARLHKKAERRLKQQRRENELAAAAAMASSSQPVLSSSLGAFSASLPSQVQSERSQLTQNSQFLSSQPVTASQVERGPHGGRPPPAKRRKRAAGF